MVSVDDTCHLPVWRNWQTQQTQNLPWETMCRFESGHRHHLILLASRGFRGAFFCAYISAHVRHGNKIRFCISQ